MAAAFREMTASLYRRIEASERFAQDVAHELKNPLTAARSTAEALAYAKTPSSTQELVRQIQEELKRLNKLITDVSNASRLDARAGAARRPSRSTCARCCTASSTCSATSWAATRDASCSRSPSCRAIRPPTWCAAHEARLGRVITNLLDNAISFSPENGVVTVRARRVGTRRSRSSWTTTGPAFRPTSSRTIFKRFYSDRPQTDRTVGKNSGLGLSISREIVNAYGGRIWASNRMRRDRRAEPTHDDQAGLRDRRCRRRCRRPLHRSAAGGRCAAIQGSAAAWPTHTELVHGTCVALGRTAALLRGPSGSGKSDLALRFLFLARRGPAALEPPILVADDQVWLVRDGERLLARPPDTIRGKIEVRGVGIVEVKSLLEAELALVVDLVAGARRWSGCPRAMPRRRLLGVELPRIALFAMGGLGSHQAGDRPGARETQLMPLRITTSFRLPRKGRLNHHAPPRAGSAAGGDAAQPASARKGMCITR